MTRRIGGTRSAETGATKLMQALTWHGRGDVRLEQIPEAPPPGPGEVRVEVEWCGICGTDVEEYRSGPNLVPTKPHPLTGRAAPLVLGHEVVGRITDVGDDTVPFGEGQRVVLDAVMSCGRCRWCRYNQPNLCPTMGAIGLQADGGLAERVTVPTSMCVAVPDDLSADTAALSEPLAVAVHAVRRAGIGLGTSLAVVGAGMIGLCVIHAARAAGAHPVIAIEPDAARRRLADVAGADQSLTPGDAGEATWRDGGRGWDVAIEAAGNPAAARTALELTRSGGRVVLVGLTTRHLDLDLYNMVARERELVGSLSHVVDEDLVQAVHLLRRGELTPDSIDAVRIPLSDVVDAGFHRLESDGAPVKVLVDPTGRYHGG